MCRFRLFSQAKVNKNKGSIPSWCLWWSGSPLTGGPGRSGNGDSETNASRFSSNHLQQPGNFPHTGPGGFQASFTGPSAAPCPHAAVAQSPHGSAFCPPVSAGVCPCAPWIQTRTSPDAPSRTECAKLQTGILAALTHMCVRPFVRFSFGRNWREPSGGGPSRRVCFVIKHAWFIAFDVEACGQVRALWRKTPHLNEFTPTLSFSHNIFLLYLNLSVNHLHF